MRPIETLKFKEIKPMDKLFREQKSKVAKQWCRHPLHHRHIIKLFDTINDDIIEVTACDCGYIFPQ